MMKSSVGTWSMVDVYRNLLVRTWLNIFPSPIWYDWIRMVWFSVTANGLGDDEAFSVDEMACEGLGASDGQL